MDLKINAERLWSDLMVLGQIGFSQEKGVSRPALSETDLEAREWLKNKMESDGLDVRTDAAMNVIGTLKSSAKKSEKVLVICSHLDTVPSGGMFDGALGVVAGLECARTLKENRVQLPWDVEIINFSDEEAAYNAGTIGSRAMIGKLVENEIYVSKTGGEKTFATQRKKAGADPGRIGDAVRDQDAFTAVLELHIEQGNRLESDGIQIGAVTGIVGIYRYIIKVKGEANHAGTTPMRLRDDALVKAAPIFLLLPQWCLARNTEMVGTIGQVTLEPGATNVIPGECSFVVELRSMQNDDMEAVRDMLKNWIDGHSGFSMKTILEKGSVKLSNTLIDTVSRAAEMEGLSNIKMPSGAGHDTQSFAPQVPCGMIFIPCRKGKSHSPEEQIESRQAAEGCQVLLRTVLEMAKQMEDMQ
ncbi:MAG: Zn-dependent hydrolase [Desulfobacterales bacterium]|jgi:hydantoinase/carbamoylase family amidase